MREIVYIETSFVSLLVADSSRDVSIAGNQQVTRDWWLLRREFFVCVTSDETLREASLGNEQQARPRLENWQVWRRCRFRRTRWSLLRSFWQPAVCHPQPARMQCISRWPP